jgi:competence protein ComEA
MNKFIKDYFTFTKSERNGLIILLSIILVLILYSKYSYIFYKEKKSDYSKFEKEIDNFQNSLVLRDSVNSKNDSVLTVDNTNLRFFDPNSSNDSTWKQIGLSEKQIHTIRNYLLKGGKFFKKEDLKKIYCINEKLYQRIEPYIVIKHKTNETLKKNTFSNFVIEINSADSVEFMKVHSLSIYEIKRILKYRALLGGFYKKEQLMEVYGLSKEMYKTIEKKIYADTLKILKININSATIKELNKSPYIDYEEAKTIVKFREKNGNFANINILLLNNMLSKEKFLKVKPYLFVE